jgi:hypothetical protein
VDAETKGDRAAQILETEVYQEAILGAKQRITSAWAQADDPTEREDLWHKLQAIDGVTTELKIIRDRGIVARQKREKGDVDRA